MLRKLKKQPSPLRILMDTIRALGQIAEIQVKHGDFEKSKQTLLEAKNMAQSITSSYNRGDALLMIALEAQAKKW